MKKLLIGTALMLCAAGAYASNFRGADQVYIATAGRIVQPTNNTFISDVQLANLTADTVVVSVLYQPINADTDPNNPASIGQEFKDVITLAPFERKEFKDFFQSALNLQSGFGLLILNGCKQGADCGPSGSDDEANIANYRAISAESRIYSFKTLQGAASGTSGQLFSGIPWYNFVSMLQASAGLDEIFITGITQNATFRSNIGLVNASQYSSTDIRLTLYRGRVRTEDKVAETVVHLTPLKNIQTNIPGLFPSAPLNDNYFVVAKQISSTPNPSGVPSTCDQGCPAFLAYGSVLDNVTNDATTLESLVFWRIVQGLGGGALISTAQAILFDVFPRREAGTAMAIFGVGVMVGPTLGPTLGGWITDNFSWPWIFYINLPLGILAAALTWRYVPEPEHHIEVPDRVDWIGLALLIVGIGSLQILLERGESHDWFASREIIVESVVAAVALVAFVWHELTTRHPVVNLRILGNRQLGAGVAFGLVLGFALYASVFALPVFLQSLLGYTAWDTGRVILPGALASAVTMGVAGKLSGRIDARLSITAGVGLFMMSMWQHYHFTLELGMHDLLLPMILRGVGMGLIFVPLTNAAVADLTPRDMAQGTGLFNLSRQLGGSFGIAITATLLSRFQEQAREALRPHLGITAQAPQQWLDGLTRVFLREGGTLGEASLRAHAVLERVVGSQASVIAFEKVFLTMGVTFVLALPLLFLFRTGRSKGGGLAH